MIGTLYMCPKCDSSDPFETGGKWLKGELQPPQKNSDQLVSSQPEAKGAAN